MKKLIVSALMALSCGVLFAADTDMYLYWMISDSAKFKDKAGEDVEVNLADYSARISYGVPGDYLNLYEYVGDLPGTKSFADATYVQGYDMLAGVGGYENSTFFIELYNDESGVAYESEKMSYGQLGAYISSMKGQTRPADTYGFRTFTQAVPEPTSGLLLLLGVAGLALRRKNKKA